MKKSDLAITAPSSTYRVQLHRDFTLRDLEQQVDYLHKLGVGAIYAAPLFKATPGSQHGYDVTDPHALNPEIGSMNDLIRLSEKLKKQGMLWIQDIVPNHMAFNAHNQRLWDVLERGEHSDYANYFDINWRHPSPELKGKLMVPFLGKELDECLSGGELKLSFSERGLCVTYYDDWYPLSVSAYKYIMKEAGAFSEKVELDGLLELSSDSQNEKFVHWKRIKSEWIKKIRATPDCLKLIEETLAMINSNHVKLERVLRHQYYLLTHWKRTEKEINYRRFFTINSLICLRMEDRMVFQDYHSFLYKLYQQNVIHGLRVDHIDGLHDPNSYLRNLRSLFGESCYIITEKILEANEQMPTHWPVQGESGYQFLGNVSQLLTNRQGGQELLDFYQRTVPGSLEYPGLVFKNKSRILEAYMGGEWDNLTHYFLDLRLQKKHSYNEIKEALGAVMLCLPVYRIYPEKLPVEGVDKAILEETFDMAEREFPMSAKELQYLREMLLSLPGKNTSTFLNRLMQFTGPLTAKGVEDTTFYVYNALISHSEVGDSPAVTGITATDFHDRMVKRAEQTPLSMNASATHDTKRGEDARMRLNTLSEIPAAWEEHVKEWMNLNAPFLLNSKSGRAPSVNDEYFIYQSIVGGFPEDLKVSADFVSRLQDYLVKVVREAKVHSNWESPDVRYESACKDFIGNILHADHDFAKSLISFMENVEDFARIYSLAQVLLKITSPGIPDIYQGCELWDLSYVDPDNRRPVDFQKRRKFLDVISNGDRDFQRMADNLSAFRKEGIEKLYVTWRMLNFRKEHPELFVKGSYQPLLTTRKGVVLAFIRQHEDLSVMVVVPIGISLLRKSDPAHPGGTEIIVPEAARGVWNNLFTGDEVQADHQLEAHELFKQFPVTVLVRQAH